MLEKDLQDQKVKDQWTPPTLNMENFREAERWWRYTHIFLEWNEKEDWIYPCFGIIPPEEETFEAAKQHRDFHKLEILGMDVENRDERRFNLLINMENAFLHFFKEVFEIDAFEEGYHYHFDLCRICLPKQKYEEIMKVVTQYGLTDVWELIFFIIAKAQDFYCEEVRFLESKEQREIIRNIESETTKAIDLIERVVKDPFEVSKKSEVEDKLLRINFIFQNNETIQIKDPILTHQFVKNFKEHYDDCYYKDWKLQLQITKHHYEKERLREQFRFRFAKALYNFFTQTGLIKLEGKPYPNNLIECIYKIIEFSLIKVETKQNTEASKIKRVRNWIKDHTLTPSITFEKIPPDFNKLYKYFDKNFIDCIGEIKKADAIKNGLSLCLQFKTHSLQNEIIHLAACLGEWQWRVSQQLDQGSIIQENVLPNEYDTFKLFINSTITNKQFDKITFHLNGEENSYVLTDKLPIHLIQSAVRYHYKNFREDYENDILQSEIKNGKEQGSFSLITTGNFNLPEERFLPKLIDSFFNFLKDEAPVLEKEYKPSDRYYSIIAKALHLTGFFRSQFPEDWELKSKVEYWHSLTKKQESNSKKTGI